MRSNKEQTEYILKKRDEYNKNMAKKKRTFLYAFPIVAIISILIITSVVTIGMSSKQYSQSKMEEPQPINRDQDGITTMNYNNKSNSDYSGLIPISSSLEPVLETNSHSNENNDPYTKELYVATTVETTNKLEETATDFSDNTSTTNANIDESSTTIAATEGMSTTIATTACATSIVDPSTLTPTGQYENINPISCYNNSYYYFENTFNSIALVDQKSETLVSDLYNNEYYAYKIKNVSEKYCIFVTDKENNYIYYPNTNIYNYKDLVNDFNLDTIVKEFTKFDGNISKEYLLNVYFSFSYDETETPYVYSKKITLLSGAKSGPTTIYRIEFNLDDSGHGRLDICSYNGEHLIACAYFKYSSK